MVGHDWSDHLHPLRSSGLEGRERMPAFIASHAPFFVLIGVLIAEILLLSFQITRDNNVRLIHVWAISIFAPFDRSLHGVTADVTEAWRTYAGLWRAESENHELVAELAQARWRIQTLSEAEGENARLRALLDFKAKAPFTTVAAEVIASSPSSGMHDIIINRGADAGITRDLAVVTPQGIIGATVAVYSHTAQVLLITDPSSGVGVMLASSRTQGIMKGSGGALCRLEYVMKDEPVTAGEQVMTSGLDQIYPKGLAAGSVAKAAAGNIYWNIEIKPAAPLDRLENVLVILRPAAGARGRAAKPASH